MQHNVHLQSIALYWCFLSQTGRWAAQGLNWISGASQRPPCDSWQSWTGGALILVGHLHLYHPHHPHYPYHPYHQYHPHHRRQQCQHQDPNHLQQALLRWFYVNFRHFMLLGKLNMGIFVMILGISMTILGNPMQSLVLTLLVQVFKLFHVWSNAISIILIPKMTLLSPASGLIYYHS